MKKLQLAMVTMGLMTACAFGATADSFQKADVNKDGCVDKVEGKAIHNFAEYAKENPKCLNEKEYNDAMKASQKPSGSKKSK